jgi:hypothetical protein
VDAQDHLEQHRANTLEPLIPGRFIGLQGRLARPFWGVLGVWAVFCGALTSKHLRWNADDLLTLALTLLLAELAWGGLWDLAAGIDWFRPLAEGWPPVQPASWRGLPYTQPGSPGGRLVRWLNRLVGWWRTSFWPAAGPALLGVGVAAALAVVLNLLLPGRLRPLNAALVALAGLALAQRCRGKDPLAGQALVQVGLGWLAGHLAFAEMTPVSLFLALGFAAAVLGAFKVEAGQRRGLGLLNGGQIAIAALLAALQQPLAAGGLGLLLFGQIVLQPALRLGADPAPVARRTWPWLLATMLIAALALP